MAAINKRLPKKSRKNIGKSMSQICLAGSDIANIFFLIAIFGKVIVNTTNIRKKISGDTVVAGDAGSRSPKQSIMPCTYFIRTIFLVCVNSSVVRR